MRHVIIGGSIAGISAARAIRAFDAVADIVILSAERAKPYYRPMIVSVIEKGDVDITLRDDPLEKYNLRPQHPTPYTEQIGDKCSQYLRLRDRT